MDSRSPLPASEYWYLGSQNPAADDLFRRVCALAWPYAVYCATRYLHDTDAAFDLMDAAVSNAEHYYQRFQGHRTSIQLYFRIISVLKRLSKRRVGKRREIPKGSIFELENLARNLSAKSETEQTAFINQMIDKLSERSRQITYWRLAGNTWRQIAEELGASHVTVRRVYHKEFRRLLSRSSDSSSEREESD